MKPCYVAETVKAKIDAGESPPYSAYARVKGMSPEETAREVGQSALVRLGDEFLLNAERAEMASGFTREGAIITVVPVEREA